MLATQIRCVTCATDFPFTPEDQQFYESMGYKPPRKCKPCRDAAKASRETGGFGRNSSDRPARPMFDVVCNGCGVNAQVPFEPNGTSPVYCRDCFKQRQHTA